MLSEKKILIVEDDTDCSIFLQKVLSHNGYKALIANSGREGIALFDKEIFLGVFLDISLSDIDGSEVAKHVRNVKGNEFPIIAFTGHSLETLREKYPTDFNLFNEICEKPFNISRVVKILQKYF